MKDGRMIWTAYLKQTSICFSAEDKLRICVRVCDENGLFPLGRQFETLQMENSESYQKFLYAWQMSSEHEMSATSFEGWIEELFEEDGD